MQRRRQMAEINVVPYIDVMLVLLVIFMITAPLLTQGVNVELPQAQAKSLTQQQQTPIIVSVDHGGHYFININEKPNEPVTARTMMTRIAAELQIARRNGQKRPVYVKGDRNVAYDKVVQAMVLLQQAGVDHVGLLTRSEESGA